VTPIMTPIRGGKDVKTYRKELFFEVPTRRAFIYIEKIMGVFPKLKVVCLERNRRAVIDSFMWKTRWQNRWYEHDGIEWAKDVVWDKTFPKYGIKDKAEAIGAYWDEYRKEIRRIARNFPDNIKLLSIEELNKLEGQHQIFDFLEIPEKNRRYIQKPKYNARESGNLPWSKEDAFKWFQQRTLTAEDIASIIPPGTDFILVDQQQVKGYLPDQYRTVSFLEQDGVYWGPPPDDETAIRELNQLRRSGAQFIVFAWTAFWFLDYYTGLHSTLRSRYRCLIENDRIVCFDLRIAEQSNGELPPPMKKSAA
jgi:hypothetical protein